MPMAVAVDLQLACEAPGVPGKDTIVQLFGDVVAELDSVTNGSEVAVRVVGKTEMVDLNSRFRGKDSATNVLSFPAELNTMPGVGSEEGRFLGDIVLCAPVVSREAQDQGKQESAHWQHLLVHGFLHLLGFDHVTDADARRMEALEIAILQGRGLQNPYEIQHSN